MPFSLQVPDTAPSTYAVSAGTASTIGNARVKTMLVATVYTDSPKNNSASYAIELPVCTSKIVRDRLFSFSRWFPTQIASHVHLDDALEHDHKRSLDHQNHFSSCCGSSFDTDLHISRATCESTCLAPFVFIVVHTNIFAAFVTARSANLGCHMEWRRTQRRLQLSVAQRSKRD